MYKTDKPLFLFFFIAFVLAWAVMALPIAQNYNLLSEKLPFEILLIFGSWMPNIAAFIVLGGVIKRRGAIKALLKGWLKWNMHPGWYLLASASLVCRIGFRGDTLLGLPADWGLLFSYGNSGLQ
jgi:hypothetical protein